MLYILILICVIETQLQHLKVRTAIDGEPKKAKKNLFHALRYVLFGIQIAEKGKITDYKAANIYYKQIFDEKFTKWEEWKKWVKIGEKLYKESFKSLFRKR